MIPATLTAESPQHWKLDGEVSADNVLALRSRGNGLLKQTSGAVVVDLAGISRSTSVCISLLLCWMREAARLGKQISFANMPVKMLDVARVSSLDSVLPLVGGIDPT